MTFGPNLVQICLKFGPNLGQSWTKLGASLVQTWAEFAPVLLTIDDLLGHVFSYPKRKNKDYGFLKLIVQVLFYGIITIKIGGEHSQLGKQLTVR